LVTEIHVYNARPLAGAGQQVRVPAIKGFAICSP
jgi:hypothetical protein